MFWRVLCVFCPSHLQSYLSTGTYENAGQLLLAVGQLLTNFKPYSSVPKVADLMSTVSRIKSMYYDKIMREFESLTELGVAEAMSASADGGAGRDSASLQSRKQACEVVDALDAAARDTLIKTFCTYVHAVSMSSCARSVTASPLYARRFCRKQLRPFEAMRHSDEGKTLESLQSRYAWFRRALRDLDGRYGTVLPRAWRMSQRFYLEFLKLTRMDVEKMLCTFV